MIKPSVKVSKTKEMIIGVVPEGPIAYDGVDYRYSKGERLYLDKLSENFKALDLLSLVLVEGDNAYETCLHSSFSSDLLHIYELPRQKSKKPSILSKVFHLLKIFCFFAKEYPKLILSIFFYQVIQEQWLGWSLKFLKIILFMEQMIGSLLLRACLNGRIIKEQDFIKLM